MPPLAALLLLAGLAVSASARNAGAAGNALPEPVVAPGPMSPAYFGSDRTVELLGDLAGGDPDPLVRARAALDLGQTNNPGAIGLLADALSDDDWRVRSAAALALSGFAPGDAAGLLGGALKKGDKSVFGAIRSARHVKWPSLAGPLAGLLKHADSFVRADALMALGEMGVPVEASLLAGLLSDERAAVRLAAARNAALQGPNAELASVLAKLAREDLPAVRGECLAAIGRVGPSGYMDLLVAAGTDRNPLVRRGAVLGYAWAGAGSRIRVFLDDESSMVRLEAVRAAGRLKRADCIDRIFEIMLQAKPAQTHLAARDALLEIAQPQRTAVKAGRLLVGMAREYPALLVREKSRLPKEQRQRFNRKLIKFRRNMAALSYMLGAMKSLQAYQAHLELLGMVGVQDPLLEQLALSIGQIGDQRAAGVVSRQLLACANFTYSALKSMSVDPENVIPLPEDNSAGLIEAAALLDIADALPVLIRFSSMGFDSLRPERSAWVADRFMPELTGEQTRGAAVAELRQTLRRKYSTPRSRFESAKSLGRLKASEAIEDIRWLLTEDRRDRRLMLAAAWAIQEITGKTPAVGQPVPRPSAKWITRDIPRRRK